MRNNEIVVLRRDCDAILIPAGTQVTLPAGQQVTITQALGGSYTCYVEGSLVRIDSQDADALGKTSQRETSDDQQLTGDGTVDEKQVWEQLATCYDPEIPINIVDLGLIYSCEILDEGRRVEIKMTLTAPGCGMGPILAQEVKERVASLPGVGEVDVEVVFDPPWDQNMMSEAARLDLGLF